MNTKLSFKRTVCGIAGVGALLLAANNSFAQTVINAYDVAANYTATGFTGNQGYGFGAWTVNTPGGGDYISGDNPPYFGLWNSTPNSASTAVRPFSSSLTVGQTFSAQLMMTDLSGATSMNAMELLDGSGNVLFSYWQQGGGYANGWYTDAGVTGGTATGFAYDFQSMDSFAFTLTSPTAYTFSDLSTGASINGTVDGTISQVEFLRANESSASLPDGQDFKFNSLEITSVPEPTSAAIAGLAGCILWAIRRRGSPGSKV
jgi:hypothetical protein